MNAHTKRIAWALLWAAMVVAGFLHFHATEPSDGGFSRGLNRIAIFLSWQAAALIPAVLAFQSARRAHAMKDPARVWPGYMPLALSGAFFSLLILAFLGAILFTRFRPG